MPKQTDKELGLFFKNARHEQKLTYEELAEKAEMSRRYLKEIENGGRVPSLDYQRLLMYLSKCNDEQITAILAIVEAYLRTYKIPTDHDKQDP